MNAKDILNKYILCFTPTSLGVGSRWCWCVPVCACVCHQCLCEGCSHRASLCRLEVHGKTCHRPSETLTVPSH